MQTPVSAQGLMWPTTPLIYASKMGHKDMAALLMVMLCYAYLPVQCVSLAPVLGFPLLLVWSMPGCIVP
jgi:hypothetical protein